MQLLNGFSLNANRIFTTLCGMNFAKKLRKWRKKRVQKQAASDLGVPLRTFQSWEEGIRAPSKLALIEVERRMADV